MNNFYERLLNVLKRDENLLRLLLDDDLTSEKFFSDVAKVFDNLTKYANVSRSTSS